jgi:prepilin-type N-terminal cleavage/methylation domain-containing protein
MKSFLKIQKRQGLTLVEIIIVVAIIAITAGVGLFVMNPAGQLASARNKKRCNDLQSIMIFVRQNIADATNFSCSSGLLPTSTTNMASATGSYNIAPCLHLQAMPFDPLAPSGHYISNTDYNTGYTIMYNATTTQITLSAPFAELNKSIVYPPLSNTSTCY